MWWPKPNKHDGLSYRRMVAEQDRAELFSGWCLMCDLASKSYPRERRGILERDGMPLTAEEMSLCTGFPVTVFTRAIEFFSSPQIGWLIEVKAGEGGYSAPVGGDDARRKKEGKKKSRAYKDISSLRRNTKEPADI